MFVVNTMNNNDIDINIITIIVVICYYDYYVSLLSSFLVLVYGCCLIVYSTGKRIMACGYPPVSGAWPHRGV